MKNLLVVFFEAIVLIMIVGCKDLSVTPAATYPVAPQAVIEDIFNATMMAYKNTSFKKSPRGVSQQITAAQPKDQYYWQTDDYIYSKYGGYIHVTGDITANFNFDAHGNFLGGYLSLGYDETINGFTFNIDGKEYKMNGAPYISIVGTFTFKPDYSFGTASDIVIGGGFKMDGPNYSETINMHITINFNSDGSGGDVSGAYGNENVNFTF